MENLLRSPMLQEPGLSCTSLKIIPTNCDVGWMPLTQFIVRGDETVEGAATKKERSCGEYHQHICLKDEHVIWKELQVWIGVPIFEASEAACFQTAACFDGARRCTRLLPVSARNEEGLKWTRFKDASRAPEAMSDLPVVEASK